MSGENQGAMVITAVEIAKRMGISDHKFQLLQYDDVFTEPMTIVRWKCWPLDEAEALIKAHQSHMPKAQIRELVRQFKEERHETRKRYYL